LRATSQAAGLKLEAIPSEHQIVINPEVSEPLLLVLLAFVLPPQDGQQGLVYVDDRVGLAILGQLPQPERVAFCNGTASTGENDLDAGPVSYVDGAVSLKSRRTGGGGASSPSSSAGSRQLAASWSRRSLSSR
jgi:hypothetical protein